MAPLTSLVPLFDFVGQIILGGFAADAIVHAIASSKGLRFDASSCASLLRCMPLVKFVGHSDSNTQRGSAADRLCGTKRKRTTQRYLDENKPNKFNPIDTLGSHFPTESNLHRETIFIDLRLFSSSRLNGGTSFPSSSIPTSYPPRHWHPIYRRHYWGSPLGLGFKFQNQVVAPNAGLVPQPHNVQCDGLRAPSSSLRCRRKQFSNVAASWRLVMNARDSPLPAVTTDLVKNIRGGSEKGPMPVFVWAAG
ncbi:hypothetical protein C8F04DRAFT_1231560 [Mycena alexandri]|uniref:Uncharacterized protein n=1 Tax=Mycena alexandri TaxID=1745969 RepID=A0AAD6T437_9AGAR|nr:hypothetical protein C8F04DRAFT_1231560 [Mycena alexandri]